MLDNGMFALRRSLRSLQEFLCYSLRKPTAQQFFWIVSCSRNAGNWAVRCLESVHGQDYPRGSFRHLFIDDASTDNTESLVKDWLQEHPGHNVQYQRNQARLGGTANTLSGFQLAPQGSVVVEVNGDDWLPDARVLSFLNLVYADPEVWMTYNSYRFAHGQVARQCRPYPRRVIRENSFRDYPRWISSHLHTFRAELFPHLREDVMIDPDTGCYWESADDMAIYLGLLELCGHHSRHLARVCYVYNYHENSHEAFEAGKSLARVLRIKKLPKHTPLNKL